MRLLTTKSIFLVVFCLSIVALGILGFWLTPVAPPATVLLEVENGASLSQVAQRLEREGVIRSAIALKLLARLRNQSSSIHAGSYRFTDPADPAEILARLVSGDVEQVSLTIPEGFNLQQIAARVEEEHLGDSSQFLHLCYDQQLIVSLGITSPSLEGYLFPETYRFIPGVSEKELIRMMVRQLLDRIDKNLLSDAEKLGLNRHQLLTLASIIEKETGQVEEMPIISSVFHNRLRQNIPLQTDPAVIYGVEDYNGNLTRKHLTTPTPYNTYVIRGLPPGPIASPGLSAIQAAAHPAKTSFLYFVSRGDGHHVFSKTLREHNQAVRRYQLKRRD